MSSPSIPFGSQPQHVQRPPAGPPPGLLVGQGASVVGGSLVYTAADDLPFRGKPPELPALEVAAGTAVVGRCRTFKFNLLDPAEAAQFDNLVACVVNGVGRFYQLDRWREPATPAGYDWSGRLVSPAAPARYMVLATYVEQAREFRAKPQQEAGGLESEFRR